MIYSQLRLMHTSSEKLFPMFSQKNIPLELDVLYIVAIELK